MRFAYADPPYLGSSSLYDHPHAARFDTPDTHRRLVADLVEGWPDGWALSLSSSSLRTILPWCPPDTRVMAWVKPWCSWKPNGRPAYCWEPVLVCGGRPMPPRTNQVRDYISAPMEMHRDFAGAKPETFSRWLFLVWNAEPGDTLDDLFPGTGAVSRAWARFLAHRPLAWERPLTQDELPL